MPIQVLNDNFILETDNTSYAFTVKNGVPVHLYYGEKLMKTEDLQGLISTKIRSFQPYYTYHEKGFALDNVPLEISFFSAITLKYTCTKIILVVERQSHLTVFGHPLHHQCITLFLQCFTPH